CDTRVYRGRSIECPNQSAAVERRKVQFRVAQTSLRDQRRVGGAVQSNHSDCRRQTEHIVKSLAVLHASQLVTLAGPKRPRVREEMSELAIIHDGGMLIRDGAIEMIAPSDWIEKNSPGSEIIDIGGR